MNFKINFIIFLFCFISIVFAQSSDHKNIFEEAFEYVEKTYVDEINESELIISAIKGMLKPLDPYTKIVVGSGKDRLDMLTKGKYGGVGIRIGLIRDTLTVLSPMEDSPAYTEGIKSGDQIIKIDSIDAIGFTTRKASEHIKGELGTKVVLHVRRPGDRKKYAFELTRANIAVRDVPYWHIDENDIGYIRVTRFSRNTYEDFQKALTYINQEEFYDSNGNEKRDREEPYQDTNNNGKYDIGERYVDQNENNQWDKSESFIDANNNKQFDKDTRLKGLIIDLRGNSGGLLREATSILNLLIRKGESMLYTKGRDGVILRRYKSTADSQLSEDVPIIVLVNNSSASASEIIAGVIQDLDRGVIVGRTTFGKGLVQQIKTINDTISLKVTNAKYYIPSGRLIQKQDWLDNGVLTDGLSMKDSIFYTINMNRPVSGGGGIVPDINTKPDKSSSFISALWKNGIFLSFASDYIAKNKINDKDFQISDSILNDFEDFYNTLKDEISYQLPGEKEFNRMKDILESENRKNDNSRVSVFRSFDDKDRYIKKMEKYFEKEKNKQFDKDYNKKWLINGLEKEFARLIVDEKARIGVSLKIDKEYDEAVEILTNLEQYYSILGY